MKQVVPPDQLRVVRLRPKNQVTLPQAALTLVGAKLGDRFLVSVEGDVVRLEPVRDSYAGALRGIWPADWQEDLRHDRDSWLP